MFNKIFKMNLTIKFASLVFSGITILFLAASFFIIDQEKKTIESVINDSKKVISSSLEYNIKEKKTSEHKKAQQLASLLAVIASTAMADFDLSALNGFAEVVSNDTSISYIGFLNKENKIFAENGSLNGVPDNRIIKKNVEAEGILFGKVIVAYNFVMFDKKIKIIKLKNKEKLALIDSAKEISLHETKVSLWIIMIAIGLLVSAMVYGVFKIMVINRIKAVDFRLKEINEGDGDLTERINTQGHDEINHLAMSFNNFLDTMHSAIKQAVSAVESINTSSELMTVFTETSRNASLQQQVEIEQIASAINQMSATVQEVSKSAAHAAESATEADKEAGSGQQVVTNTIQAINSLASQVDSAADVINEVASDGQQISVILDVIRSISEQTNLLALNAAIEAARAGEQGRGFAVVADEVRTLASRTQKSTEEIQQMIEKLQSGTKHAVDVMVDGKKQAIISVETAEKAGETLNTIKGSITTISDMNTQIASAAEQQSAVSDEVNNNISKISESANVTACESEKCANSSKDMSRLAIELSQVMSQFKV